MRLQALAILFSIIVGIIVPSEPSAHDFPGPVLGTLDVCDPDNPFIDDDMPCVNECVCGQLILAQKAAVQIPAPIGKPAMLVFEDERPPEA